MGKDKVGRDFFFLKHLLKNEAEVTDEEVRYIRKHPAEIDDVTAPIYVHRAFLAIGFPLGAILVFVSKLIQHVNGLPVSSGLFREFAIDINIQIGVALDKSGRRRR